MPIIAHFIAIHDQDWKMLVSHPEYLETFLYPDDEEIGEQEERGERWIDVDKAWHVIHFLLTGSAWEGDEPNRSVIWGGIPMGEDMGYGPARFVDKEQVHHIHPFLQSLPKDMIDRTFNIDALKNNDIYPGRWENRKEEKILYVKQHFEKLKEFYQFGAEYDLSVIQFIR